MRFKTLLGLVAIGGAVAYAQKKRGGELTVEGFKKTFRDLAHKAGVNKTATSMPSNSMRTSDDSMPSSHGTGTTTRSTYGDDFSSGPNGTGRPR